MTDMSGIARTARLLASKRCRWFLAIGLLATAPIAAAQDWPARPVRFVVPFAAGSSPDVTARILATRLGESLGRPILVENRGGAAGIVAAELVAKSAPDGYTFFYPVNSVICANAHLYSKLPYDPLKSFVPVSMTVKLGYVLLARPDFPARDLAGLLAMARAQPDKLNYGSGGPGAGNHVSMELLLQLTSTRMTHIPHRDGASSVVGGDTDVSLVPYTTAVPLARAGKHRPLGVTLAKRLDALPDVPAIGEAVPGYVADVWHGLFAPAGTPAAIVDRLAAETARTLQQPEIRKRLIDLGIEPVGTTPAEFAETVRADFEKWGRVIRTAQIKLD